MSAPMSARDWPYLVFVALDWVWFLLGSSCLAAAVLVIARRDALSRAEDALRRLRHRHGLALLLAGLALPASFALYNVARHEIHHLTADSAIAGNLAWNVLHGHGLRSMMLGDGSYFAVHFAFAVALFAPFLWLWNSVGTLAVAQGALVGTAPLLLFLSARRKSGTELVAWLVLLLTMAHPMFFDMEGSVLDSSIFAFPFFVAAAHLLESGAVVPGLLVGLLMFSAREQVPFVTSGVGLYLLVRRERPRRGPGAALLAGSVALWLLEMKLMNAVRAAQPESFAFSGWGYFQSLGGSGPAVFERALHRPWDFLWALVSPPEKLLPVAKTLAHVAFLPLAGGAMLLPVATAWLPHQLAEPGSHFQELRGHYGAFVLGPMLWAMMDGLVRLQKSLGPDARRKLAAAALAAAAWGFLSAHRFHDPAVAVLPRAWRASVPKALAAIPPDAAVWCDAYLSPDLAMRRYVKILPRVLPDHDFQQALFVPDYVLMSMFWARLAEPDARARVLRYLREGGFEPVFHEGDLILLANTRTAPAARTSPAPLTLP